MGEWCLNAESRMNCRRLKKGEEKKSVERMPSFVGKQSANGTQNWREKTIQNNDGITYNGGGLLSQMLLTVRGFITDEGRKRRKRALHANSIVM